MQQGRSSHRYAMIDPCHTLSLDIVHITRPPPSPKTRTHAHTGIRPPLLHRHRHPRLRPLERGPAPRPLGAGLWAALQPRRPRLRAAAVGGGYICKYKCIYAIMCSSLSVYAESVYICIYMHVWHVCIYVYTSMSMWGTSTTMPHPSPDPHGPNHQPFQPPHTQDGVGCGPFLAGKRPPLALPAVGRAREHRQVICTHNIYLVVMCVCGGGGVVAIIYSSSIRPS